MDVQVIQEAMENLSILEKCNVEFPQEKHYPKCASDDFDELLRKPESKRYSKENGMKFTRIDSLTKYPLSRKWATWTITWLLGIFVTLQENWE